MTNPTPDVKVGQCDRDIAADVLPDVDAECGLIERGLIRTGQMDDHPLVISHARHRDAERAAIVAWLRSNPCVSFKHGPATTHEAYARDIATTLESKSIRLAASSAQVGEGWIVGNDAGDKWRAWVNGSPIWTDDRAKATRYARRVDAEAVHAEDEDAWRVELYAIPSAPAVSDRKEMNRLAREARERAASRPITVCATPDGILWLYGGDRWRVAETNTELPAVSDSPDENCERCQGNGEIVIDWDRYLHEWPGDKGDEAVAECPDCNGTGSVEIPAVPDREALAREVLADEYEATAPAGKYVARDIRNGNLVPDNERAIRAMLAFADRINAKT